MDTLSTRPMRFGIAPDVLAAFPTYCVGLVIATGVRNAEPSSAVSDALDRAVDRIRKGLAGRPLESEAHLRSWLGAFREAGIDPIQFPPSIHALARRAVDGEGVPRINPAVDLANAVSLDHLVPVGAHDLDRLRGDFVVRYAVECDRFTPIGQNESDVVPPGEIVFADERAVRTRRWVWRLGERAKITPESHDIIFPIDGFVGETDDAVRAAMTRLAGDLSTCLGARVSTAFVARSNPFVDLPVPLRTGPDAIEWILERGIAEIIGRDDLEGRLRGGTAIRIYLGVDPTSPVIHLGHAVAIRKLRKLQDLGNKIVLLIGDFTGRIGDPTDKSGARVQLTHDQVLENASTYIDQAARILDVSSSTNPVEVRYNGEWWDKLTARDIVELAANFTAQQMLQRDMFQKRLEENKPIGLHEFLYPLLQGYDSVALEVDAEIGGTDQTFNMLAGRSLVRVLKNREKFVLTVQLLEGPDGRKMSKSYGNVIGVTEPPYDMYGKLMSIKDDLIARYFQLLTDISDAELKAIDQQIASGTVNPMALKKRLACEIVSQFHSAEAAWAAQERFEREIQHREVPMDLPEAPLPRLGDWPIVDLLLQLGLATSKGDAKRLVEGGSVQIDGEKVGDPRATIPVRSGLVIRGRRRQYVKIVEALASRS